MPAEVSSGRSLSATLSSTHSLRWGFSAAAIVSTGALPEVPATSNVDVRMETTFVASEDCTVWTALPA